ncbi:MAG TPA: peptidoglycan DD-metalloendopeptidase family protein [Polyangiaceae bacterium]|nr:peptidoglycan DD-metalloendopeptidase family protein [Polyangiaceae bacterium]
MTVAWLAIQCERRRGTAHEFHAEAAHAPRSAQVEPRTIPALSLAWGGSAQTDFDARQLNANHDLSLRFMAAYEAAFRGVLLADESGSYRVGLAPYASLAAAAIEVRVGGASLTYPLPDSALANNDFGAAVPRQPRAKWRHVAVKRQGDRVTVRLDGALIGELTAGALPAQGKVRLGRLARPDGPQDQFYGFIAEVTLNERTLAASNLSLLGSARSIRVSSDSDAELDASRLPAPTHTTRFSLPFPEEQVWLVIQGANSALSHNDTAAFALDFIRVDPHLVRSNPGRRPGGSHHATEGAPLVAAASGRVVSVVDCFADDNSGRCVNGGSEARATEHSLAQNRNLICVEHSAGETTCLLHLQQRSARVAPGVAVERGQTLALAGSTGIPAPHLHFALCDRAEPSEPGGFADLVTLPLAFDDYFASDDFGETWRHVARGTPAPGQWVSRAKPPR